MRVAWVFTGLPRFTAEGSVSVQRLMAKYDSTVFAHLWTSDELGNTNYKPTVGEIRNYGQEIMEFQRLYSPKAIKTEQCRMEWLLKGDHEGLTEPSMDLLFSTIDGSRRWKGCKGIAVTRPARSYFLFRSMKEGLNLVDGEFDLVVKCRTDLRINKKGCDDLVIGLPEKPGVLYTVGSVASTSVENKFKVNDMLMYSKPEVMAELKNLVDDYWDLARIGQLNYNPKYAKEGQYPLTFEAHTMLYNYLQFKGIQVMTMGGDTKKFCWRFQ